MLTVAQGLFVAHVVIFFLASIVSFVLGLWRSKMRNSAWIISLAFLVTSLAYLCLVNFQLEYIRWLGYAIACPLLAYEAAKTLGCTKDRAMLVSGNIFLTMLVAVLILFADPDAHIVFKVFYFLYGCAFFVAALILIGTELLWSDRPRVLGRWIFFGIYTVSWGSYAVVFLLSPAMITWNNPSNASLAVTIAYFVLEFVAKIGVSALNLWLIRNPKPAIPIDTDQYLSVKFL